MTRAPADSPAFDRTPPGPPGRVEAVSARLRRLVAGNAGPFTFTGTCSYIVGSGEVAIVDPGPEDAAHVERLLVATAGERITAIVVTHTHRDHSPAAAMLRAATGARTFGGGPHRPARPPRPGDGPLLDASADLAFVPDVPLADGAVVAGPDWTLAAVATPGHCANHLAFALVEDGALLSGDHVMAWSTSIVAPPDGAMGDYRASLQRLLTREETVYFPGHGGPILDPNGFIGGLLRHRRMREEAILAALSDGATTVPAIVARVYAGLDPALEAAAALNTLAHLEDLVGRGLVVSEAPPALDGRYGAA
jgi:glyoxylase-like metal-dependent hydrolase (beta-lactamase superfamily II)